MDRPDMTIAVYRGIKQQTTTTILRSMNFERTQAYSVDPAASDQTLPYLIQKNWGFYLKQNKNDKNKLISHLTSN